MISERDDGEDDYSFGRAKQIYVEPGQARHCCYHQLVARATRGFSIAEHSWLVDPCSLRKMLLLTQSSAARTEDLSSLSVCRLRDRDGQMKMKWPFGSQ